MGRRFDAGGTTTRAILTLPGRVVGGTAQQHCSQKSYNMKDVANIFFIEEMQTSAQQTRIAPAKYMSKCILTIHFR